MPLINNLKNSLYQRKLEECHQKVIERIACNLEQAKAVGLLAVISNEEDEQVVLIYQRALKDLNKNVTILAYNNSKNLNKNEPKETSYACFYNNNLGFDYIPKTQEVTDFIEQPFDLLISMHLEECLPLEYISAASKARFRIGYYQETKIDCYDLMVYGKTKTMRAYLQQVESYLKKMR